ncbi:hypothetical protein FRC0259_02222 [Corynebacterium diphtheriae]|nr:hypothetical protein FRC0259_02222 [Corynebacterium diphtheriae]
MNLLILRSCPLSRLLSPHILNNRIRPSLQHLKLRTINIPTTKINLRNLHILSDPRFINTIDNSNHIVVITLHQSF